ncbi:MAG: N-acetylmuramoyl-L-alanine amidase [Pseudomonadota bacterium]
MKRALTLWSIVILSFCGILAWAEERATSPHIKNIRLGVNEAQETRVVLDMDAHPKFVVTPTNGAGGPEILIWITNGQFALDQGKVPTAKGLVKSVSSGPTVLELSLTTASLPVRSFVIEPSGKVSHYRLVVDLAEISPTSFAKVAAKTEGQVAAKRAAASKGAALQDISSQHSASLKESRTSAEQEAIQTTAVTRRQRDNGQAEAAVAAMASVASIVSPPAPSLKPASVKKAKAAPRSKPIIVLDPGHGGRDPGAIGKAGLQEKAVTLAGAKTLRDILVKRGYDVILTRESDVYVDLFDRIEKARLEQADLFLSIHADANASREVRGASVYTLEQGRSDRMAKELTASGNFRLFDVEITEEDEDIGSLLIDLANTDTQNEASRLATAMITEMKGRVRMVNNTHRFESLKVLLSPDVPAVLFEMAFLSNKSDEANLGSPRWRKATMTAVADGIDLYFDRMKVEDLERRAERTGFLQTQ